MLNRVLDAVLILVAWAIVACSAFGDDATYWKAKATSAIAIETANNPWFPPPPPPPPPPPSHHAAKRAVVYRLHAKWCGPCKSVEKMLTKEVREKLPFDIEDWDVDERGWMGAPQIPAFWWKSPKGPLRIQWTNIETLVKTWEFNQKQQASTAARSGWPSMAGYRSRWTWPGDLRRHLMSTHGVSEANQLSQDQAEALHDALHEGYSLRQIKARFGTR